MDITVKGRHTEVSERFRQHVAAKLAKLERFGPSVGHVDVEVCEERNPRQADNRDRVEITCHIRGPVIRAEAAASDPYAALDLAYTRLESRLRRAADRRRVHHGARTPASLRHPGPPEPSVPSGGDGRIPGDPATNGHRPAEEGVDLHDLAVDGEPRVVREKTHRAGAMTLDQALHEMELVGHDFYLFVDEATALPSVVYRRHGFDYGVIRVAR